MTYDLARILAVYEGSDGESTKQLYADLEKLGAAGTVALNLFRAEKSSSRAKEYRGGDGHGSYRSQAYHRKEYALGQLCEILGSEAVQIGVVWGWGVDSKQEFHKHVLYVDIPTGQVSFHAAERGTGPEYPRTWDGRKGQSEGRIITWIVRLFAAEARAA